MNLVSNGLHLTPLRDESLQNTELVIIPWPVTFRIVDDEMLVVRRGYSFVYIGRALFVMLDILNAIWDAEQWHDGERGHTARDALNIALISDDFPTPDYERAHEPNVQAEWE
jgi:hypothetical protein